MRLVPITLKDANTFVGKCHRHHKPDRGHKFSIGLQNGELCGVVIVGRPKGRGADNGFTAEVTRLCTDGTKNACSMLYAAAARACRAMGYDKIQTYILETETGDSLRAAGWEYETDTDGGQWYYVHGQVQREMLPEFCGIRRTDQPICKKQRWVKHL